MSEETHETPPTPPTPTTPPDGDEVTETPDETTVDETVSEPGTRRMPGWALTVILILVAAVVAGFFYIIDVQHDMNRAKARVAQGQAALLDGDLYKAMFEYSMALTYDSKIEGAHQALGRIAISNGQGDDAVRHFLKEIKINPADRDSRLALGCLYTLACVHPDDPQQVKGYLLSKFEDVLPYNWPDSLDLSTDAETDPLTEAVVHYHFALENLPGDPAPVLGLALTDVAVDNLTSARERLSRLTSFVSDESYLPVIQSIIEDINREEQFRMLASAGQSSLPDVLSPLIDPPADESTGTEDVAPASTEDLSGALSALPPIPGQGSGGFGSRDPSGFPTGEGGTAGNNFGLEIQREDLTPQPTIKPITRDIFLEETGEVIKTTRLANLYESGDISYRLGETITMPFTGTEVMVIAETEDTLLIQERGHTFKFRKGAVGWNLVEEETGTIVPGDIPQGITVHEPEENEDESDSAEEELGPEVETE